MIVDFSALTRPAERNLSLKIEGEPPEKGVVPPSKLARKSAK